MKSKKTKQKLLLSRNEVWCGQQTNRHSGKDTLNRPKVVKGKMVNLIMVGSIKRL